MFHNVGGHRHHPSAAAPAGPPKSASAPGRAQAPAPSSPSSPSTGPPPAGVPRKDDYANARNGQAGRPQGGPGVGHARRQDKAAWRARQQKAQGPGGAGGSSGTSKAGDVFAGLGKALDKLGQFLDKLSGMLGQLFGSAGRTPPQGAASGGAAPQGAAPGGAAPGGAAPQGAAPQGAAPQGAAPQGAAPQGAAPGGPSAAPAAAGPAASPAADFQDISQRYDKALAEFSKDLEKAFNSQPVDLKAVEEAAKKLDRTFDAIRASSPQGAGPAQGPAQPAGPAGGPAQAGGPGQPQGVDGLLQQLNQLLQKLTEIFQGLQSQGAQKPAGPPQSQPAAPQQGAQQPAGPPQGQPAASQQGVQQPGEQPAAGEPQLTPEQQKAKLHAEAMQKAMTELAEKVAAAQAREGARHGKAMENIGRVGSARF